MTAVHYHYWFHRTLEDGRPIYVQDPTVYQSKATCHRHAKAQHGDDFMVLMCRDDHQPQDGDAA